VPVPTTERRPVIWAFSTSRLRSAFESVAPLLAEDAEVHVFDGGFEAALATLRARRAAGEPVDALVAAGANGAYLRDHADVPVVVVGASTVDTIGALLRARQFSSRIGVVNFSRVVTGIDQHGFLMDGATVEQRPYLTPEEARTQVLELAARGFEVIVGPGPVCDLAEQAGLKAVLLYGQDSLAQAIRQAIEIARVTRADVARHAPLRLAVDQLEPGLAVVDLDERVLTANAALLRLLSLPSLEVLGRPLSAVAPALGLARVLEAGIAETDTLERVGGRSMLVGRTPLRDHGTLCGAMVLCQEASAIQRMDRRLRSQHRPSRFEARYTLGAIVGTSPAIRAVRAMAERYARTDATVLITGESGTGKEMVAQGIHAAGRRRDHPFVAINCAAFPETLLESELFGYEEGAFTGSRRGGRPGLFEAAHLGTIFLDEVGDVPLTLQSRLLRVLQERQVLRLGSNDPTPVDVRVIAATHRDLRAAVAAGQFRDDLYFRLHILPIHLPPLRARHGDVAAIASDLLRRALTRHGVPGAHGRALSRVLPRLEGYAWPGNVRELENVLERVAVLFADGAISDDELDVELRAALPELFDAGQAPVRQPDLRTARQASERAHVERVVAECGGNLSEAARRLGVGRSTLYRKLAGAR
jgi:transcriptional regulator, propionate catabolism operon regulatory protein